MFESAEVGHEVGKARYAREEPRLRRALLEAQSRLASSNLAVVILVSGVEGSAKGETVNLLHEWMDVRGLETHVLWEPSDEERERPPAWRHWRALPAAGRIGILFGSWYTQPIIDRVFGRGRKADFDRALERCVSLERMLGSENVLVVKLWLHLSKRDQRRQMKKLASDPLTSWRVSKLDREYFRRYDRFREVSERALRRTSTEFSPWHVIESVDDRYRALEVGRRLLAAMTERLDALDARRPKKRVKDTPVPDSRNPIRSLDLTQALTDDQYERRLERQQARLALLARRFAERGRSMIVVFEGPDAAGKGGAIRRVVHAIDSRSYKVISVGAPTDEERAHPYLWRFWRHLPRQGNVTVYDRSWYGRVLVERLEGFCERQDWQRAFSEINDFEEQLTESGIVVMKYWIAVSPREQLRRFRHRERTPYKQYKITEEDWRNRARWNAYEAAACEMFARTSTESAPWILVEGEDKNWARVKVVRTLADRLARELKG